MVSIVIPNYNGKKYLRNCIDAIYEYEHAIRAIEIIIIDNASTDDDFEWIREFYPKVIFKALAKNYGFSRAVNEGIRISKGKYVILLNNDTEIQKGFIDELVKAIEHDEKIFSVCSQMIQYANPHLIDDAGDEYNLLGWTYKRGDGENVNQYTKSKEVFSACAGAAIYRKAIFDQIGYFDENFFAYMEDVDISYRARIHGYKNMYCADAKVLHIGSATSGSRYNDFKVRLAARNNIYVVYKNMPVIQLIINLPFLMIGWIIKYSFFATKGFGKVYRQGFVEGISTLSKVKAIPFESKHISNYVKIEIELIKNLFKFFLKSIKKKLI